MNEFNIESLNQKYDFKSIHNISYVIELDSLQKFKKYNINEQIKNLIKINKNGIRDELQNILINRKEYAVYCKEYNTLLDKIIKSYSDDIVSQIKLFFKRVILKTKMKHPKLNFKVTFYISYTSPAKRNHYEKKYTYNYDDFVNIVDNSPNLNIDNYKNNLSTINIENKNTALVECNYCGRLIKESSRFCCYCGKDQVKNNNFIHCSKCGKLLKNNYNFCMYCGTPVISDSNNVKKEIVNKSDVYQSIISNDIELYKKSDKTNDCNVKKKEYNSSQIFPPLLNDNIFFKEKSNGDNNKSLSEKNKENDIDNNYKISDQIFSPPFNDNIFLKKKSNDNNKNLSEINNKNNKDNNNKNSDVIFPELLDEGKFQSDINGNDNVLLESLNNSFKIFYKAFEKCGIEIENKECKVDSEYLKIYYSIKLKNKSKLKNDYISIYISIYEFNNIISYRTEAGYYGKLDFEEDIIEDCVNIPIQEINLNDVYRIVIYGKLDK